MDEPQRIRVGDAEREWAVSELGEHLATGRLHPDEYSDRSKVVAGVLQLALPFGIGRFYTGHHGIAVAQLLLSFVLIGVFWAFVDGIVMLADLPTDPYGRPLRP